jgi:ubiquinone/menaquinone biosynthesis C-methylase UbiE
MSYLYMKILELIPEEYDRGIQKFAATDFEALREEIASGLAPGQRLLDVGCGPGTLALLAASRGVRAVGWDRNPDMITFARGKAVELGVSDTATFEVQDAPTAAVDAETFDAVVLSLALSEMRGAEQLATLETAWRALKLGGRLVIVDEVGSARARGSTSSGSGSNSSCTWSRGP